MAILIRTIKCPYSLTCIYHTKLLILFKMKKGICVLLLVFVLGYYVLGDEVPTEHISNAFKEMDELICTFNSPYQYCHISEIRPYTCTLLIGLVIC
jgi:hypothetical protein